MRTHRRSTKTVSTELGETENVEAVASALAKQAAGKKLSNAEQSILSESRYGARVENELNPENIRSGGYSSEWAEELGANRIHVEEYSRLLHQAQAEDSRAADTEKRQNVHAKMWTDPENDAKIGKKTWD